VVDGCKNCDSRRCSRQVAITPKRKSTCPPYEIHVVKGGAERSGGERKPITYQQMSETKRSEAERLSEALLLMEVFGEAA
jgi:hypothetical protein